MPSLADILKAQVVELGHHTYEADPNMPDPTPHEEAVSQFKRGYAQGVRTLEDFDRELDSVNAANRLGNITRALGDSWDAMSNLLKDMNVARDEVISEQAEECDWDILAGQLIAVADTVHALIGAELRRMMDDYDQRLYAIQSRKLAD